VNLSLACRDEPGRQHLVVSSTGVTVKHDVKLTIQNVHGQRRDAGRSGLNQRSATQFAARNAEAFDLCLRKGRTSESCEFEVF
jgi:hypothetical protein